MPLELRTLYEGFSALGADVDPRAVRVQVLPHGRVVPEHFRAALVRTRYSPRHLVARLPLGPENLQPFYRRGSSGYNQSSVRFEAAY